MTKTGRKSDISQPGGMVGFVSILSAHAQDSTKSAVLTLGDPVTSKAELSDQESIKESTQNAVLSLFHPWLSC